jgi:predicted HNH restriction endonuclease
LNQQDVQEAREIQEDEWIAKERDYFMYQRIVQGMINRSSAIGSSSNNNAVYQRETDKAIANVMRTHYKKMDSKSTKDSLAYDDDDDEPELAYMYNESGRVQCHNTSCQSKDSDSDRPPDTIFIMEL